MCYITYYYALHINGRVVRKANVIHCHLNFSNMQYDFSLWHHFDGNLIWAALIGWPDFIHSQLQYSVSRPAHSSILWFVLCLDFFCKHFIFFSNVCYLIPGWCKQMVGEGGGLNLRDRKWSRFWLRFKMKNQYSQPQDQYCFWSVRLNGWNVKCICTSGRRKKKWF